jgi:hypothetical protein
MMKMRMMMKTKRHTTSLPLSFSTVGTRPAYSPRMEIDFRSTIEALEGRIAPAIISVDFTGGALTITSDNGDHAFTIEALDATTFQLTGGTGTQFQVGSDPAVDSLRLTGPIKSLNATLGSGLDFFDIIGLNVGGDVSIDAGAGNNNLEIISLNSKGSLEITGGDNNDDIILGSGSVIVKKNLTVDLGDGTNFFRTAASITQAGGDLTFTGGTGNDTVELASATIIVGKSASFTFGGGNASLQLTTSQVSTRNDFIFDSLGTMAGETSTLGVGGGQIKTGGSLVYRDGAATSVITSNIFGSRFAGKLDVVTGGGSYNLQATGLAAQSIEVDASASAGGVFNIVNFGGSTGKLINFKGGDAGDNVTITETLGKPVSVIIDLGEGQNSANFQFFNTSLKNISVTGGAGVDNLQALLLNAKISGAINVDLGDAETTSNFQFINSRMAGVLSVAHGDSTGASTLAIAGIDSQIGGIEHTSNAAIGTFNIEALGNFVVKGAVNFTGLAGDHEVTFGSVGGGKVGKGISLDLGDGSNQVTASLSSWTTKSFAITGGTGGDTVFVSGNANLGAVNFSLGAGNNLTSFEGEPGFFLIARTFAFTSTSGTAEADTLNIARLQVLGKFDAKFGDAQSSLQLNDSSIGSIFSVDTGAGMDTVNIDTLDRGTGVTLAKPTTILLGEGNDTLILGGNSASQLLTTKSKFRADGGAGTNTVANSPTNIFAKDPVFENFVEPVGAFSL